MSIKSVSTLKKLITLFVFAIKIICKSVKSVINCMYLVLRIAIEQFFATKFVVEGTLQK